MAAIRPSQALSLSPQSAPSSRFSANANHASSSSSPSAATRPLAARVRSVLLQQPQHAKHLENALNTLAQMYPAASISTTAAAAAAASSSSNPKPLQLVDTARARRDLDKDVTRRMLTATDHIISVLKTVDDGLVRLSNHVAAMHTSCDAVQHKLRAAQASSRYLVEHAEGLERQRAAALTQVQVSNLFLARFTLSEAERASIYSRQLRVGNDLFTTMDKLQRIRTECQILLQGSESISTNPSTSSSSSSVAAGGGTRAAIDIMSSTAQHLDHAYQKLYKWSCFEFRQPVKEGLEVSPSLRQATRRLKDGRQDLLRSALTTLVQTRSSILANAFMAALTMGAGPPTYLPGPIELHAHDPIRYVGDMLAWIHQTVASEREFLTALFDEKEGEGGRRIGQRRRGLEGSIDLTGSDPDALRLGPGEALVREVLNSNLDGCCRPLKLRIQQTLRSQEGSVTSYRLAHLVQFYRSTMDKTIGSRATLSKTLGQLSDQAVAAFADTVQRQSKGIERYDGLPEPDLSLPAPLSATLATLKELLGEFSRSLVEDASAPSTDANSPPPPVHEAIEASLSNFDFVLIQLVDPLLKMVERMATLHVSKRPRSRTESDARWESLIFTCNCIESLLSTLGHYTFAGWKATQLRSLLERTLLQMSQVYTLNLVLKTGLAPILAGIEARDPSLALSSHPGLSQNEVGLALEKFEHCLSQDDLLSPRDLDRLASPSVRQQVHTTALRGLTERYARIVSEVLDESSGYQTDAHQMVKTSPEQVAILLGI
ncbi:related to conserved oligomeric Golgi complex component 6 [Ustilago trichophora]|uniref:Conserved oligomeric Golgi complex subunit 6 n=1 Tax=Ustilago trichophora TaxID=86804 RepID=A0A5C3EQH5_9BASI|nr:related to conserved oligomeric Golgi complex component 6 [Ustilago trichophora]